MARFMLRWRFDYSDGKPTAFGAWNDTSEGKAALTNKTGLCRAAVEGFDPNACGGIVTLAECDGWDFINFAWVCLFDLLGSAANRIVGLSLVTREEVREVLLDGRVSRRIRTEDEKKIHLAGFGR